jgi:predicted amidohydrolase YtcJ
MLLGGDQRVTDLATALEGITVNPATQLGLFTLPNPPPSNGAGEPLIGSLEVGKQADFVVLGSDLESVNWTVLDQIPTVKETWIGGVRVYRCM